MQVCKSNTASKPCAGVQGQGISVSLEKQGVFDADYDVFDISTGAKNNWMLIDTVGGIFSGGLKYYLKHRMPGEEKSRCLGSCVVDNGDTEFDFKVTDRSRKLDFDHGFDSDRDDMWSSDSNSDDCDITITKKVQAKWNFKQQCKLFADYEMTQRLGKLTVKSKATYKRKEKTEVGTRSTVTDANGNEHERHYRETVVKDKCKPKQLQV